MKVDTGEVIRAATGVEAHRGRAQTHTVSHSGSGISTSRSCSRIQVGKAWSVAGPPPWAHLLVIKVGQGVKPARWWWWYRGLSDMCPSGERTHSKCTTSHSGSGITKSKHKP